MKYLAVLLLINLISGFPISSDCDFNQGYYYDQVYCGTEEVEKLVCEYGKCRGIEYNNMCSGNTDCAAGFFCDSDYKMCSPCMANCASCTEKAKCVTCDYSYYYATTNECLATSIANCLVASAKDTCTTCYPYFFLSADDEGKSVCLAGPANCIVPVAETDCSLCAEGYYWNSETTACESAIANCAYGSTATSCYTCNNYYYLVSWTEEDNYCDGPLSDCSSYMIQKPGYCTACYDGYYLYPHPYYQYCIQVTYTTGCKTPSGSEKLCATCLDGYVRWPYCYDPVSNCKVAKTATTCSECDENYVVNSSELCSWCGWGVATCSIADDVIGDPITCQSGYWKEGSLCLYCGESGATTCTKSQHDQLDKVALTCYDGFYLYRGTCYYCKGSSATGYKSCSYTLSGVSNWKCADGYQIYTASNGDVSCLSCGTGVKTCTLSGTSVDVKSACMDGYVHCSDYNSGKGDCVAMPTGVTGMTLNCGTGTASVDHEIKEHTECAEGYILAFDKACHACGTGESSCTEVKTRTTCISGYTASLSNSNDCIACAVDGAVSCTVDTADAVTAVTCNTGSGYAQYGTDNCAACPSNALTCTVDSQGAVDSVGGCDTGYAVSALTCKACSTGDAHATSCTYSGSTISVTGCATGYYHTTGQEACLACTDYYSNAETCTAATTDTITAVTCESGYGHVDGGLACTTCDGELSNASECEMSTTTTTLLAYTCESGYGDSGSDSCILCTSLDSSVKECYLTDATTIDTAVECVSSYKTLYEAEATCSTRSCTTSHVATCSLSATTYSTEVVITCDTGYHIDSASAACLSCNSAATDSGAVLSCDSNSGADTIDTSSKTCISGYTLHADGYCYLHENNGDFYYGTGKAAYCDTGYRKAYHEYYCVECGTGQDSCTVNVAYSSTCKSNYYAGSTSCTYCGSYVDTCSYSSSTMTVDKCIEGYQKKTDSSGCKSCGSHALACTLDSSDNVSKITSCEEGYVIKYLSDTYSCEYCGTGVSSCTYVTISGCVSQYILNTDTNSCDYCSATGALTCDEDNNPLSCREGYVSYSEGGSTSCLSCNTGYSHVKTCSVNADGDVTPITCYGGYYLKTVVTAEDDGTSTTTLSCEDCDGEGNGDNVYECAQNSIAGATPTMNTCVEGSYQTYTCVIYAGSNCITPNSPKTCSVCSDGYTVAPEDHSSENTCVSCGSNVKTCTVSTAGVITIGECMVGAYKETTDTTIQCTACGSGCETCSESTGLCTKCLSGYYLTTTDDSAKCTACGSGVATCSAPSGTSSTPTIVTCLDGYYLATSTSGSQCTQCQESNCKTCGNNICTACDDGYFIWSDNKCYAGPSNCKTVNLVAKCSGCDIGKYWDPEAVMCKQCSLANCVDCSDAETCLACETGYYLKDGVCTVCPWSNLTHCVSCSDAETCNYCEKSYYYDSTLKQCVNCSVGCEYCGKAETCYECSVGYYKTEEKLCSACIEGCDVCPNSVNCTTCSEKYYLTDDSTCTKCYKTCLHCQNTEEDGCIECPKNATLEAGEGSVMGKCACNEGFTWDDELEMCVSGTGSASYIFCGLLSFLVILIAIF